MSKMQCSAIPSAGTCQSESPTCNFDGFKGPSGPASLIDALSLGFLWVSHGTSSGAMREEGLCLFQVKFAEELVQRYLLGAARKLAAFCRGETNGEQGPEKEVARVWLHYIQQSLNGLQSCLPDFQLTGNLSGGQDLAVHAKVWAGRHPLLLSLKAGRYESCLGSIVGMCTSCSGGRANRYSILLKSGMCNVP